jgi:hypothetical protein
VRVESDRRYRFALDRHDLWRRIVAIDDYRGWWPWLRRLDATALEAGDVWHCVVQPPLPYSLRFSLTLDEVVAGELVAATIAGEIEGTARLELFDRDGEGCEARLLSHLSPASGVLMAIATVARPVVRFGHDWVLDTGARQFRQRAVRG